MEATTVAPGFFNCFFVARMTTPGADSTCRTEPSAFRSSKGERSFLLTMKPPGWPASA